MEQRWWWWPKVKYVYANFLLNGENSMTRASMQLGDTAHHNIARSCYYPTDSFHVSITLEALFLAEQDAIDAAARWTNTHTSSFESKVAAISGLDVTVVTTPPQVLPWRTGLDCDPIWFQPPPT
eukprot:3426719-Rhodomonas_salina.1